MRFLHLLKKSRGFIFFVIVLGLFSSLLNGGLLVFINSTISNKPIPFFPQKGWLVFLVIIVSSMVCSRFFQTYMIRLTNGILYELELEILNKLKFARYEDFEGLGNEKVYAAINDTRVLASVPEVFMNAFNSLIIVVCCFGYLFWIAPLGAAFILVVMMALFIFYTIRNNHIEKELNTQRDLQNVYFRILNDLLAGFRELKISIARNENIFTKHLFSNRKETRNISIRTSIKYMENELTGSYSWYIVLGVAMFALPGLFHLSIEKIAGFLITILYLIGPVAVLVTLLPTYTSVKISLQRLDLFDAFLKSVKTNLLNDTQDVFKSTFRDIRFESVTFKYHNENGSSFALEPIDLCINKGDIIFITGGNGSGKSTFGHLLTGLYRPAGGRIFMNDIEVTSDKAVYYSNQISAIFTNNHLFSENYDEFDLRSTNAKLQEYLDLMKMSTVIELDDEHNKISKKLSKGQQKRLALILSLLEGKEIVVLDEWAAEQDPTFRAFFYTEMIYILREMGKTVVAITHDEDYFSCATRILRFNFGKMTVAS